MINIKKTVIEKKFKGVEYEPFGAQYVDTYDYCEKEIYVAPDVHKNMFWSNCKAIVSGGIVEIITYEKGNFFGGDGSSSGKKKGAAAKKEYNLNRTKKKLRRLINANVTGNDLFITLTYKENMIDVDKGKKDFKVFIKAMKRKGYSLNYVYVVEFQKRGAVHFHCIFFGCGFISSSFLGDVWKHGFVKINRINDVDNAGAYVVKYMDKDLIDDRLISKDLYGRSRGLSEPLEINNPQEVGGLLKDFENVTPVYVNSYSNEYKGLCSYKQYNLNKK